MIIQSTLANEMKKIYCTFFLLFLLVSLGCFRSEKNEELKETITAFSASIDSANQATKVINDGEAFSIMGPEDSEEMIEFYKEALAEAHRVDYELLNQSYDGLGKHYQSEFVRGIEMVLSAHETLDREKAVKGQELLRDWGIWFEANYAKITGNN